MDPLRIALPTPFKVGDINVYLLKGDVLSLVDTGVNTEESWQALLHGLSEHGMNIKDIDQILLTHHHVDHFGLAARIMEESPNVKLYCHSLAKDIITFREQRFEEISQFFYRFYLEQGVPEHLAQMAKGARGLYTNYGKPVVVSGLLEDNKSLPGHPDWLVYHTPGHAQDQLCFYHENSQIMLASDHLIKHMSSNAILEAPRGEEERAKTLLQYRESLKRCREIPISVAFSGHGEPIYNVNELIQSRLARQEERARKLHSLFDGRVRSAFEIASLFYRERVNQELPLILSEIIGHMDLLEEMGLVLQRRENHSVLYEPQKCVHFS